MFYPGKVENWHIIIELNEIGISDVPFGPLKKIINIAANHYQSCLERIWIMNPSGLFSFTWKVIESTLIYLLLAFIDERSAKKI